MVTTVVGQVKEGVTPFDAVSQAFPPGKSSHYGSDCSQPATDGV